MVKATGILICAFLAVPRLYAGETTPSFEDLAGMSAGQVRSFAGAPIPVPAASAPSGKPLNELTAVYRRTIAERVNYEAAFTLTAASALSGIGGPKGSILLIIPR